MTHANITALYRPNQRNNGRLGIVISKQHVKLAVQRNNRRRIIRESFRQHKQALKGLDIVILIRSEWTAACPLQWDKKALREDIETIWQLISKRA